MLTIAEYVDGSTLIIVNFVLHTVSAIVMLVMYLGMREAKGLFSWMLSNISFAFGFLLLMTSLLDWAPIINSLAANLLIDAGALLAYVAVLQFLERPKRALWLLAPPIALSVIETIYFLQGGVDFSKMIPLGCTARAIVTIGAGWQLLRHASPYMRPASTLSAIFHFIWAAMLFSRVGWWMSTPFDRVDDDPTTPYALMTRIVLTFVVTPSYLWMVTRRLDNELLRQAQQDPLTGIANRRVMWERGERILDDARRSGRGASLLMLDVDHFKSVNDRFGHGVGDRVLVGIAAALVEQLRDKDMVARVGGEEFMVLLPDADQESALAVADRLRAAVETLPFPLEDGKTLHCTISVGMSLFGQDGRNWENLVTTADRALYCAKRLGRNRVETAPLVETASLMEAVA